MLIILQVSAFPGTLQTSGISSLSHFHLSLKGTQEAHRDDQQSRVISGFVILVLHSDPIPPNQTIENVYVRVCVCRAPASSIPGNVLSEDKLSVSNAIYNDRGSFHE